MINDYTESNIFILKIINNKIHVYYYDDIDNFSDKKITILNNSTNYIIKGNNLIIEKMDEEELIINGNITTIEMAYNNEK